MTEPDKAQLWVRLAAIHPVLGPAYRAGAAASEARIKALEGLLGHFLGLYCGSAFWDVEKEPEVIEARALLKEADQ